MSFTQIHKTEVKLVGYTIFSYWGPRRETPTAIATRILTLIDRLVPIDPVFEKWICAVDSKPVSFEDVRGDLTKIVEQNVDRADDGDPTPIGGYRTGFINTQPKPRCLSISVHAGAWGPALYAPFYMNSASIRTCYGVTPDPAILKFQIFRAALLALVETFDATWSCAYPNDAKFGSESERLSRIGWMNYVSPRFAALITPPKTAIVEYRPNGGLLIASTKETFVTTDPQHLVVAEAIKAALAPLNALPWPPDAEPEEISANT